MRLILNEFKKSKHFADFVYTKNVGENLGAFHDIDPELLETKIKINLITEKSFLPSFLRSKKENIQMMEILNKGEYGENQNHLLQKDIFLSEKRQEIFYDAVLSRWHISMFFSHHVFLKSTWNMKH